jgi:hypothetical protein
MTTWHGAKPWATTTRATRWLWHTAAAESVWEAFARKLGLPELPDGGYRVEENPLTPEEVAFLKD